MDICDPMHPFVSGRNEPELSDLRTAPIRVLCLIDFGLFYGCNKHRPCCPRPRSGAAVAHFHETVDINIQLIHESEH